MTVYLLLGQREGINWKTDLNTNVFYNETMDKPHGLTKLISRCWHYTHTRQMH